MKMTLTVITTLVFLIHSAGAAETVRRDWTIDGIHREALVAVPPAAQTTPSPLVFVFHGHGGRMNHAARTFRIHELWPEAVVVYMQGLNTPGELLDKDGKKPGWQNFAGDQQDRDLHFFDAVLKTLKSEVRVDEDRIYATGHSNGGAFTYLLWAERHDVFAAMAPSGAAAMRMHRDLRPKPLLHIAGDNDPLVKYAWQTRTVEFVKRLNQCAQGTPHDGGGTLFASPIGTPVVLYVTSQGHKFPAEAPPLIVQFFQQFTRPSVAAR